MTTDPKLRKDLLAKIGITKQGLSYRAKKLKELYGPMTTEEAVYVIAHMEGFDLSQYLSISTLDRVRALVPRQPPSVKTEKSKQSAARKKSVPKPKSKPYPLVSNSFAKKAEALGESIYPLLFIIENSIRNLISSRMASVGSNWWDTNVPAKVRNNVQRTITKEARYPYRDKRGNHPLSYSNFADLKEIILANPSEFQNVILDFEWFKVRMDEVYMARNNIAHCVPLAKDDETRIRLFFRDWARLLDTAGIK